MSKDNTQQAFVPRLRFPEFRNDQSWSAKALDEYCERLTDTVGDAQLTPVSISSGVGFVAQAEKFGRDISGAQYANYIHIRRGDFAYNRGNSKRFPQGCVYRLTEFDEAAASNAFYCFRLHPEYAPAFFEGLFESNCHGRQLIKDITSSARSTGLLNIKSDTFFGITIPMPPDKAEHHKIADCLGSLDDLIAAEGRKLAALRDHKQGLMQQLFPREGETQPHLRFPEFRDEPDWGPRSIEQLCEVLNNRRVPITSSDRVPGPYPYYGASGIVDYVDDYIFNERLVLVGEDGAKWKAFEPTAFIADGKYWVNNHAHVLKPIGLLDTLLASYLTQMDIGGYVTGAAPPKLTLTKLKTIPIPVPPSDDEQRCIADCLTALDARVTAQEEKLDALRTHKRGLMQQLFPTSEVI